MGRTMGTMRGVALLALTVALGAATPVEGQQRSRPTRDRDRDRAPGVVIDTTFAFAQNGTLEVQMPHLGRGSGDVTITGWGRSEMRVEGETAEGMLSITATGQHVEVGTRSDQGQTRVERLELRVPYGTRIRVNNGNGDVTVSGTRGSIAATSFNGDLTISDATDRLELRTFNGDISATNIDGRVSVNASNGDIDLRTIRGDVEVSSLNGDIDFVDVTSTNVRAKTLSGGITFDGAIERAGEYSFNAFSGSIDMSIPANTGATLSISTFSGTVDSPDFPLTLKPGPRSKESKGQSMTFDLGGGGARISLESFSGEITIRERRTGGRGN